MIGLLIVRLLTAVKVRRWSGLLLVPSSVLPLPSVPSPESSFATGRALVVDAGGAASPGASFPDAATTPSRDHSLPLRATCRVPRGVASRRVDGQAFAAMRYNLRHARERARETAEGVATPRLSRPILPASVGRTVRPRPSSLPRVLSLDPSESRDWI